jgi:outer membrane protein assembly factor BamB
MTLLRRSGWTVLAVLLLAAASSPDRDTYAQESTRTSVPMFRGDAGRTGQNTGPGPTGVPVLLWSARLGQFISSSPAVVGGIVYVGTVTPSARAGGALHAVDGRTGEELWRIGGESGDGFVSSPAVSGGIVYVGSYYGDIVAASLDGAERWRSGTDGGVVASPAVIDGVVYVGDVSGVLHALDAQTGRIRWRFANDAPYERVIPSPSVSGDTVYIVSVARRPGTEPVLYALATSTGEERWRFTAVDEGGVLGIPVVAGGRVHVATLTGSILTLDARSGALLWSVDAGERPAMPLAVSDEGVFVAAEDGFVHAFRAATGDALWSVQVTDGVGFASPPTIADGVVYLGDAAGALHALDAASGRERWVVETRSYRSAPAIIDGVIFISGEDGFLRAFGDSLDAGP